MSCFLVTGATGFICSAIVRRRLADGREVDALTKAREPTRGKRRPLYWRELNLLNADGGQIAAEIEAKAISHCVHSASYNNHADYLTHEVNRLWVEASFRQAATFQAIEGGRFVGLGTCHRSRFGLSSCVRGLRPSLATRF